MDLEKILKNPPNTYTEFVFCVDFMAYIMEKFGVPFPAIFQWIPSTPRHFDPSIGDAAIYIMATHERDIVRSHHTWSKFVCCDAPFDILWQKLCMKYFDRQFSLYRLMCLFAVVARLCVLFATKNSRTDFPLLGARFLTKTLMNQIQNFGLEGEWEGLEKLTERVLRYRKNGVTLDRIPLGAWECYPLKCYKGCDGVTTNVML